MEAVVRVDDASGGSVFGELSILSVVAVAVVVVPKSLAIAAFPAITLRRAACRRRWGRSGLPRLLAVCALALLSVGFAVLVGFVVVSLDAVEAAKYLEATASWA